MNTLCGWLALTALPALPLAVTLLNLLTWRRGQREPAQQPRVSVLIPARNEENGIATCVRAAAECGYPLHEILVYDDQSSDRTLPILRELERELPRLHVLAGAAPAPGWVGKPHACQQLAQAATGDVLLFVDADTQLLPGALPRILSLLVPQHGLGADVVSALPHQVMVGFAERLLMPLLHLTYTSWLPLFLVQHSADSRFVAANGQLMAFRREGYDRIGGFSAVAHEIVDDVALCRHAKQRGARVVFADGALIARCRMYRSLPQIWSGFSKNLYEGIGATPSRLLLVVLLYLAAFVAPYLVLTLALVFPAWSALLLPAAVGVALNGLLRLALALRFRQPMAGLLLHPLSVLVLCALAVNSYRWSARGRLLWAGRSYGNRKQRAAEAR
jgi:chlorobactene glucosyltransferase